MALKVALRAFVGADGAWSLEDMRAALLYADELAVSVILTDPDPPAMRQFGPGDECALTADGAARPVPANDELRLAITAGLATVRPNLNDVQQYSISTMLRSARTRSMGGPWWEGWDEDRREAGAGRTALVPAGHIPVWSEPAPRSLVLLADSYDEFLDRLRRERAKHLEAPGADAEADAEASTGMRRADVAELRLASHLLGELPVFPHADVADLIDVRERLAEPRLRFRAAMAAAGRELADTPPEEFAAAADAYAREHVGPAALDMREQLREMGAFATLLRAVKEPWAVPTVASLAVATAMLDPGTVVAIGGSATAIALTAREMLTRRGIRARVAQQPFWYLREVDRELRERVGSSG